MVTTGIIIDESHGKASTLDQRILRHAHALGYGGFDSYLLTVDVDAEDYSETLYWESERAVDYMNDHHAPEGYVYVVDDNSLYLEREDMDNE